MTSSPSHSAFSQFYAASLRKSTGITSMSLFTPLGKVKLSLEQPSCQNVPFWIKKSIQILPEAKTLGQSIALLTPDIIDEITLSLSDYEIELLNDLTRLDCKVSEISLFSSENFKKEPKLAVEKPNMKLIDTGLNLIIGDRLNDEDEAFLEQLQKEHDKEIESRLK